MSETQQPQSVTDDVQGHGYRGPLVEDNTTETDDDVHGHAKRTYPEAEEGADDDVSGHAITSGR